MSTFIFRAFEFDQETGTASFRYGFSDGHQFTERVSFRSKSDYDKDALDQALFLAFILIGTSYFKTFPTSEVRFEQGVIDEWQADFLNRVYQEGLSQFAFENNLERRDLAHFEASGDAKTAVSYSGEGAISLQSGGKDSLLVASLLEKASRQFDALYISSSNTYPAVLDEVGSDELVVIRRIIDRDALVVASEEGGLNGHVPVTYIVLSLAVVQAILLGKSEVLAAIGHEGEEPHAWIDDLPVNHQWSKTWSAEQAFAEYVRRYISSDIHVGSPLRQYNELRIAELFVEHVWEKFGHRFSSCNVANYGQGAGNATLTWCGNCPKCANSYLLFAPFVAASELQEVFGGEDLFEKTSLTETFKGLLGIDGIMKPFECVGEVEELRLAYHMALSKGGYVELPFEVPTSSFDMSASYAHQSGVSQILY